MKWCQRCGQQLKPVLPGKSCTQCGWVRPLVAPRRKAKQASILTPLAEMHARLRTTQIRLRRASADSLHLLVRASSALVQELVRRQTYVLDDLSQDDGGKVAGSVVGHRCLPAVGMAKLAMRSALANLYEPESLKDAHGFAWFENGQ